MRMLANLNNLRSPLCVVPVLGAFSLLAACQGESGSVTSEGVRSLARTDPASSLSTFPVGEVTASYGAGVLSEVETAYGRVRVLRVAGTPYEMGEQYGNLVGPQSMKTWDDIVAYLAAEAGLPQKAAEKVLGTLLDKAWAHMEPYVPAELNEELDGIADGALAAAARPGSSAAEIRAILTRAIALSNTSDLNAFGEGGKAVQKMIRSGVSAELEQFYKDQAKVARAMERGKGEPKGKLFGRTCSFFSAWGPRTMGGTLFASRNLDWSSDTGIANQALITVYRPTDGVAYATFGYAGLVGALAGMNEYGVAVSEVGSNSVLEKLKGEPWTLKFREILSTATNLDDAAAYMINDVADGRNRPTTLGYNFQVAYGDPQGRGANAGSAVFETNGGTVSMYYRGPDCVDVPVLYTYDDTGRIFQEHYLGSSPEVNTEAQAREIDADANVRLFKVENGQYVRDAEGYLVDDPSGEAIVTGRSLTCAAYRGDEAMGYGARRWQTTGNGPSGDEPKEVLIDSETWNNRYGVLYGIMDALWNGQAFNAKGKTWVPAGTARRLVDFDQATVMAQASAMSGNVLSVVYDATNLKVRLAYESGSGASWVPANENPYAEIDMTGLFSWE